VVIARITSRVSAATRRARRAAGGIRVRIVVGYVLLLACALTVAVVVTRQVQTGRLEREIDRELAQEVEELRVLATTGIDPTTGQPFGEDAARILDKFLERNVPSDNEAFYTIVGGRPYRRSFNAPAALLDDDQVLAAWTSLTDPTTDTFHTDVGEVRSLAVPLTVGDGTDVSGVFVVAFFPDDAQAEIAQVIRVATITGIAVLALSVLVAWSLAGRVLSPVRELTRTARLVSGSDLSARIPVEGHDELTELGETFNEMVDRLEEGFRAQRRFLDDVAHELRTPITIARGHLEVLGDDPVDRSETVEIVTDELDRMSRYVTDLLLLAKAEQPEFLSMRPVDLGELATDALSRVKALAPRRWVLDAAPPVGTVATLADPDRLGQALVNLAANAAQHTVEDAQIGVGVAVDGELARLWVRDTGPGVDQSVAGSLFDRYSRGATSRAKRPEGTGIGLSIVDVIARAHGGAVSVFSRPGAGATFTITIPLSVPLTVPPNGVAR
jgi:signal transduction histidine kinase